MLVLILGYALYKWEKKVLGRATYSVKFHKAVYRIIPWNYAPRIRQSITNQKKLKKSRPKSPHHSLAGYLASISLDIFNCMVGPLI